MCHHNGQSVSQFVKSVTRLNMRTLSYVWPQVMRSPPSTPLPTYAPLLLVPFDDHSNAQAEKLC